MNKNEIIYIKKKDNFQIMPKGLFSFSCITITYIAGFAEFLTLEVPIFFVIFAS